MSEGRHDDWEFVHTYRDETVQSGYQFLFPSGIFSFQSVRVDVLEKDTLVNVCSATFPGAICDDGSGDAEITLTGTDGKPAAYKVTCSVTRIDHP